MLRIKPMTDPAARNYFCRDLALPSPCDFCFLAEEGGALQAIAAFGQEGELVTLSGLRFLEGPVDLSLADGLLRASLSFAQLEQKAVYYLLPDDWAELSQLGFTVGKPTSIEDFFRQGHAACCGR